jgi:hypothetical protein
MPVDEGTAGEVWGMKLLLVVCPALLILLPFRQAPWWVYVMVAGLWLFALGVLYIYWAIQDRARQKGRGVW